MYWKQLFALLNSLYMYIMTFFCNEQYPLEKKVKIKKYNLINIFKTV